MSCYYSVPFYNVHFRVDLTYNAIWLYYTDGYCMMWSTTSMCLTFLSGSIVNSYRANSPLCYRSARSYVMMRSRSSSPVQPQQLIRQAILILRSRCAESSKPMLLRLCRSPRVYTQYAFGVLAVLLILQLLPTLNCLLYTCRLQ